MVAYYLLQVAGIATAMAVVLWMAKHFSLPRLRTLGAAAAAYLICAGLLLLFRTAFPSAFEGRNGLMVIALFPWIFSMVSGIFRLPISKTPESASPMLLILFGFDRIGCQCIGRCASDIVWDCGIPAPGTQEKLLPLQLAEAAAALLLAAWLIRRLLCRKKEPRRCMALSLMILGALQIPADLLRGIPPLFAVFSPLSLCGLFLIADGVFWMAANTAFRRLGDLLES